MKKGRSDRSRRIGMAASVHKMHTYMNKSMKVPQKGRIRIFLVVLLIAAAGRNVLSYVADALTPSKEEKIAAMIKKQSKKELREEKKRKQKAKAAAHVKQSPTKVKAKAIPFEYSDLMTTIAEHLPTLTAESDTVQWKNHTLIRYFSLDTALQNVGNKLMKQNHPNQGAMVVLQPKTGRVLALVSYNNPKVPKFRDNLFINADIPAASIFKTITAAAAIEKNAISPEYEFPISGNAHTLYKNQIASDYKPSYKMTFSQAYSFSVNPIFGRMGIYYTGINTLQEYAQKFGFNDTIPFELPVGISKFTAAPLADTFAIAELASGYNKRTTLSPLLGALIAGGITQGGKVTRPTIVDSVIDIQTGTKIYENESLPWRVLMTAKGAATLKTVMQATTATGTARKGFAKVKGSSAFDSFQHGGKTGNINTDPAIVKGRAEWFVGFLRDTTKSDEDLACAIVQIHGQTWNIHSSYLGAEMLSAGIKGIQKAKEKPIEVVKTASDSAKADSGRTASKPKESSSTKK